jgi:hypothetical protein
MKRSLYFLLAMAGMTIISCQKEIDWSTPATSGPLLVKVRSMTGTDSTIVTYNYDGQNRLAGETTVGAQGTISLDMTFVINRNTEGIITSTVQKSPTLLAMGLDSLVTRYHYDATTSKYTSKAFSFTLSGISLTDSAILTYDSNGRITNELHYIASGLIPAFPALENRYNYNGSGTNMLSMTQFASTSPGSPLDSLSLLTYTYDGKTNPLNLRNEGILLGRFGLYNSNNATMNAFSDITDPTQNFTFNYNYVYNSTGRPDSSYQVRTPGGQLTASKYFYQ